MPTSKEVLASNDVKELKNDIVLNPVGVASSDEVVIEEDADDDLEFELVASSEEALGRRNNESELEVFYQVSKGSVEEIGETIQGRYMTLKARYMDITDAGAKEYFIIDGDSLMAHFLCNPRTNKLNIVSCDQIDEPSPFPTLWSPLQIIWLIERFITELKLRSCVFDVVFFDCNAYVWLEQEGGEYSRLLLFRALLERHLKKHFSRNDSKQRTLSGDGVFVFTDWLCGEWLDFIDQWKPRYLVMVDGNTELAQVNSMRNNGGNKIGRWLTRAHIWQAMAISVLTDVPLVLFDRLEIEGNHIKGFMVHQESVPKRKSYEKLFELLINNCQMEISKLLATYKVEINFAKIIGGLKEKKEKIFFADSEATRLTLLALVSYLNERSLKNDDKSDFARLVCIWRAFCLSLPLSSRCLPISSVKLDPSVTNLLHVFYKCSMAALVTAFPEQSGAESPICDVCDFFDEKLFLTSLNFLQSMESSESLTKGIDETVVYLAQQLWDFACDTAGKQRSPVFEFNDNLSRFNVEVELEVPEETMVLSGKSYVHLLKNDLFIEILEPVLPDEFEQMRMTPDEEDFFEPDPMTHQERYHWHYMRELTAKDEGDVKSLPEWKRKRLLQKFMAFQQRYAESLLNTLGLYFKPVVMKNPDEDKKDKKEPASSGKAKQLIAENMRKKEIKYHEEALKQLADLKKKFRNEKSHDQIRSDINELLSGKSPVAQDESSRITLMLLELQMLESDLAKACKSKLPKEAISLKLAIYEKVKSIYEQFSKWRANQSLYTIICELLERVGFTHLAKKLHSEAEKARNELSSTADNEKGQKKKSTAKPGPNLSTTFEFDSPKRSLKASTYKSFANEFPAIGVDDLEFQMQHCGHLFNRNTGSAYDARVGFDPDDWQRQLLDIVDCKESALVCAPTSSGKTFISFYAMEQVVTTSDSDVVVYVAPTKALVNQTAAEAYARFGQKQFGQCKTEKNSSSAHTVVGVYTRDYRHFPMDCQILVCVPEILEILMLSPVHAKTWVPRVKRIIFDEIHQLGELSTGKVWEHLLLLAPCPILALSATISNCDGFYAWLSSVQAAKGFKTHLVQTTRRYCDLRKHVYIPRSGKRDFKTIRPTESSGSLVHINPLSTLSAALIAQKGFPTDMKLMPEECLQVFQLIKHGTKSSSGSYGLERIEPLTFFKDQVFLTMDDADRYEKALKEKLVALAGNAPEFVTGVISSLDKDVERDKLCDPWLHGFSDMIAELAAESKLPAIVFCLDRKKCMTLAMSLYNKLEQLETSKRNNDPNYQRKKEEALKKQEALAKQAKRTRDEKDKDKDKDKLNRDVEDDHELSALVEQQDPDCTLVFDRFRVSEQDLKKDYNIDRVVESLPFAYRPLMDALSRGIGIHHAGLPRKYRELVEMLFRCKHLSVVIATGTLALGIHAPCRTVVFAGNNAFLSSLNHRQMMGRAGRRGFDLVGDVVYFGVPKTKLYQLLSSPLPPLAGHIPVTTSLVLRTLCLQTEFALEDEDGQPSLPENLKEIIATRVSKQIKSLFCSSLFSLGRQVPLHQILHQLRFSIDYLLQHRLVRSDGRLTGLAGLIQHMFYTEPANLAFAALLKTELIESVLGDGRTDIDSLAEDFMAIFAAIFNQVPLHVFGLYEKRFVKTSPSIIELPRVSSEIVEFLHRHNQQVIGIFRDCMLDYVRRVLSKKTDDPTNDDTVLPLSKLKFPPTTSGATSDCVLLNRFNENAVHPELRSLFSALSGHGDDFNDGFDFATHARAGLYLDASSIPTLSIDSALNAYIFDYYKHGQIRAIERDNGIKEGESYARLKDSLLLLKCMSTSLKIIRVNAETSTSYDRLQSVIQRAAFVFEERLRKSEQNTAY